MNTFNLISIATITRRLNYVEKDIQVLKEFYKSTLVSESISQEKVRKYSIIIRLLKSDSLLRKSDKYIFKYLNNMIGHKNYNQKLYYDLIQERMLRLERPLRSSEEYYAYLLKHIIKNDK